MSISLLAYKTPGYLVEATKKKYGKKIRVIGATKRDLDNFWARVGYRVDNGQQISRPVKKAKIVVDIDSKTHANMATKGMEDGPDGERKVSDWYDDFQITSRKKREEGRSKKYNLHLSNTKTLEVGGNFSIKTSGFFNIASPGVPEAGISGKYLYSKTKEEDESEEREESLAQDYKIVDTLKVPPNTKVKATITSYAITYESKTVTRLTVDAKAAIKVTYCSSLSKMLGGFWKTTGIITAEDLFEKEEGYAEIDGKATFTRDSDVSYIGEEVEIHKTSLPYL